MLSHTQKQTMNVRWYQSVTKAGCKGSSMWPVIVCWHCQPIMSVVILTLFLSTYMSACVSVVSTLLVDKSCSWLISAVSPCQRTMTSLVAKMTTNIAVNNVCRPYGPCMWRDPTRDVGLRRRWDQDRRLWLCVQDWDRDTEDLDHDIFETLHTSASSASSSYICIKTGWQNPTEHSRYIE